MLALLIMVAVGCGLDVTRPEMEYYFTHPVLNEEWKPDLWRTSSRSRVAAKLKKKSKKRKSSSFSKGNSGSNVTLTRTEAESSIWHSSIEATHELSRHSTGNASGQEDSVQ